MITLRTGIPRHGKTLHMVQQLGLLLERWDKHPEEARPIFCHKIYDLSLPHNLVPLVKWKADKAGSTVDVPDWDAMPDGSLVLIDECDKIFPPRSASVVPPDHVNWLTEHGHKGFDIWLTTQHPKFIDTKVRALTGKHQHFRRIFGSARSMIYEWESCSDSLGGMASSVKTLWHFPKDSYKFYKSANIHTKQSFRLPLWLALPVVGLLMGLFFIPKAYSVLSHGMSGEGLKVDSPAVVAAAPVSGNGAALAAPVAAVPVAVAPLVVPPLVVPPGELPDTPFTRPAVLAAACVASETKCRCYTGEGVRVEMSDFVCRKAAAENLNFADIKL